MTEAGERHPPPRFRLILSLYPELFAKPAIGFPRISSRELTTSTPWLSSSSPISILPVNAY